MPLLGRARPVQAMPVGQSTTRRSTRLRRHFRVNARRRCRARGHARWPVRVLLSAFALLLVGSQIYTFERYQAYVNHRAVLVGTSFLPSIGQQLWR